MPYATNNRFVIRAKSMDIQKNALPLRAHLKKRTKPYTD